MGNAIGRIAVLLLTLWAILLLAVTVPQMHLRLDVPAWQVWVLGVPMLCGLAIGYVFVLGTGLLYGLGILSAKAATRILGET